MSRPLVPLARPVMVSGVELHFPVHLSFRSFAALFLAVPRHVVAPLLAAPLRPVPGGRRGGSLVVSWAAWDRSPVGAFNEVTLWAPTYVGRGSPLPGLAVLLHGRAGHTDVVGDLGYAPLWSLVDREEAALLRRELWHVPVRTTTVRIRSEGDRHLAQVQHGGDTILRLHTDVPATRSRPGRIALPVRGRHEGKGWSDHGDLHADAVVRRWRRAGRVEIYAGGPIVEFAVMLGASDTEPLRATAFASLLATDGAVRFAGPRPSDA
ncbi:MAG: hypothetical protein KY469_13430 [Actinobacteria bacterium]|nr:hypothetical protein [Actinomycetota bacterium]